MTRTRSASEALVDAALAAGIVARGTRLESDVPFRDIGREQILFEATEFRALESQLRRSTRLRALYGTDERRLALHWMYRAVATGGDLSDVWSEFWIEVLAEDWQYVAIANLTNFQTDLDVIQLAAEVSIRPRNRADLKSLLGWSDVVLDATLGEDWQGWGSSEHVMISKTSEPKSAGNVVTAGTGREITFLGRALTALRLAGVGDVGLGTIFLSRVGSPSLPLFAMHTQPRLLTFNFGSTYEADEGVARLAERTYPQLGRLDDAAPTTFPEIRSALDRFRAAYDRPAVALADRLVDDVIALEAIAVVNTEVSYTVAVRVSGLLADDDADRVSLLRLLKDFYSLRSIIVHGGQLKPSRRELLAREPELRSIVRSLLRGLLNLADSEHYTPNRQFLSDFLDDHVLDPAKRARLRAAMGTPGWMPSPLASPPSSIVQTVRQWADQPPSSAIISVGAPD